MALASATVGTNEAVSRRIRQTFRRSMWTALADITVTTRRGHVVLTGKTESQYLKQVAHILASRVSGVVHVNNEIAVTLSASPDRRTANDVPECRPAQQSSG